MLEISRLPKHRSSSTNSMGQTMFRKFLTDTNGATAIEYALIAGLIALVVISAVSTIGTTLKASYLNVAANLR